MTCTIASFTYDKKDGSKPKDRKLLVVSQPRDTLLGIEFDDLADLSNVIGYIEEKAKMDEYLKSKYSMHAANYKSFKAEKMSNLVESKLTVTQVVK